MSLRARLSLLSVSLLLALLMVSGVASYVALGTYQRINEAAALDRRYDTTLREFRAVSPATLARPGVAGCVPARNPGSRPFQNGTLNPAFASECVAPAFAGQGISTVVVGLDAGVLACATGRSPLNGCAVGSSTYTTLPAGDYLAALRNQQRRYYVVGSGAEEQLVVLHRFPANGRAFAVIQLSEPTETLQRTQRSLLLVLAVSSAALILVAGGLTPLLVGRALRPLRRVTEASSMLAAGKLEHRVEEPGTDDEVGRLARAFNLMAAAVQRALNVREESEAGMRTFVSDASHELRTPLTTLQGQLDVLGRGAATDPAAMRTSLGSMNREVGRMSGLVEDLLTLTRLESPGDTSQRTPVDLDSLVAETVEEQSVRDPAQAVEVAPAPRGEAVVEGDPEQLRRVVLNLATNALKYAPGGTHRWTTTASEDEVILALSDEGPGIAPEFRPRVFDRFYRGPLDGGPTPGSGLGLAIVRSIVEAHGGRVTATGDGGATLTVFLPRFRAPETPH
ncbi:MAG: HAMP domain-containing histidine kinase [Candidatus Dormibacteraeota bacterium]|nr:HAMP domain-containing histidine kinase [Candidatus Dormibacteraeota bacterium]